MGINYSLLNHELIYKSSLENVDDLDILSCVFSYLNNTVEFIDEPKILIYKKTGTNLFWCYKGNIENLLNNNYDSIDIEKLKNMSNKYDDFFSMKEELIKIGNKKLNTFLKNYEATHLTVNNNYFKSITVV